MAIPHVAGGMMRLVPPVRKMHMPRRNVRPPSRLREIDRDVNDAIARHSAAGMRFEAGGVRAFARQQGSGADVVLLHGVPTSSFLYRRVLPVLADQGLRGTALRLPGPRAIGPAGALRLLVVGTRVVDRRRDRRARA